VKVPTRVLWALALVATLLIAGCAAPQRVKAPYPTDSQLWHGRLAVRIEADTLQTKPQSFSAEFELAGSPLAGELILYTPLGTTAATLSWSAQTAVMRTNTDIRTFESLDALIKQAIGTDLPVTALFAWLAGDNAKIAGWSADLSQYTDGRITARRTAPTPAAELRLVLEK
jgi:outer membrane lipoprotein LolB